MTGNRLGPEWRDLVKLAAQLGFEPVELAGRGHPRFYNAQVDRFYVTAGTPSDWRAQKNAVAEMERISGRKIPRQKAGKLHHRRITQLDVRQTERERQCGASVDALADEARQLRACWRQLTESRESRDRTSADAARKIFRRYAEIEMQCERMYRVIPPITEFDE